MKAADRITLSVWKLMRNGVLDRFTVIVSKDNKDSIKQEYESAGYHVAEA